MKEGNIEKRYLVIMVDRRWGRFFTIYLGDYDNQSEELIDDHDDVPQKVKNDNGRWGKVERHIRDHLKQHLKKVCDRAMKYLISRNIKGLDGVFIGGHKELFPDIKNCLPSLLQHKIIGQFVADVDAPMSELTAEIIKTFGL
jgi:hypothetical protein